jgi:hypothetical protein
VVLARRAMTDLPSLLPAVATVALPWRFRKLQEPAVIAAAALVGARLIRWSMPERRERLRSCRPALTRQAASSPA